MVKGGVLFAPPKDNRILEGIRYGFISDLAAAHGLPFEVRPIAEAEVRDADELILSSATKEVLPVVTLDGRPVGDGRVGPVYARLYGWYQDAKAAARPAA